MNNFYEAQLNAAKQKLDDGVKEKLDRYGEAMKNAVRDALLDFCRQDGEFAQAVAQGGSFKDCMGEVAKGVKNGSISDMEAFGRAVKFFFPGAELQVTMRVELSPQPAPTAAPKAKDSVLLDLSDFF